MPACSCSAYLCCPFARDRNAKRVTILAKEDEFPLVPNSESGVDKFQSWRPRNTNWTLDFPPKLILILEWDAFV